MGCLCSKRLKPDYADRQESYFRGYQMIHGVLRRSMERIISCGREGVAEDQRDNYRQYVRIFHHVLTMHHHHEDDIVFPWLHKKVPGMLAAQEVEHKQLETLLDQLMANADKASPEGIRECADTTEAIQTLLLPHLAAEENMVSIEWLREHMTQAEIKAHTKVLMKEVQKSPPEDDLCFIILNCPLEERGPLEFPGFVENLLFPKWAAVHGPVWDAFATHVTKAPNGKFSISGK